MKWFAAAVPLALALSACGPGQAPEDTTPAAPPATDATAPAPKRPAVQREISPDFFVIALDPLLDAGRYPGFARDVCGERPLCRVGIWTDESFLPRGFPMTDREVGAQAFQYSLNRDTGFEQTIWNCEVNPQADTANCGLGND